jgi:16S rRNA (cytosine1402-N4)-methyltransferase
MNTNRAEYLTHDGVMISEISDLLIDVPDGIFIDATYGYGSHFKYFKKNHNNIVFLALDRDIEAVNHSPDSHDVQHYSFSKIKEFLVNNNIKSISGVFYDFGLSSHQIDSPHRGFSFQHDSVLDMRMDVSQELSAKEVINNYSYDELLKIFYDYGEESNSKKIARAIINNRPIKTTNELVSVIESSLPRQNPKFTKSSVRKIFQAVRIEVNNEINEIIESLESVKNFIKSNGIMIFLSYHSIEDRTVKQFIEKETKGCICDPKLAICTCESVAQFKLGKYKKRKPSNNEIKTNPRSKSAVLRFMVKI